MLTYCVAGSTSPSTIATNRSIQTPTTPTRTRRETLPGPVSRSHPHLASEATSTPSLSTRATAGCWTLIRTTSARRTLRPARELLTSTVPSSTRARHRHHRSVGRPDVTNGTRSTNGSCTGSLFRDRVGGHPRRTQPKVWTHPTSIRAGRGATRDRLTFYHTGIGGRHRDLDTRRASRRRRLITPTPPTTSPPMPAS